MIPQRPVRDASELLWPAVSETLTQLDLKPEDAAAKKLAQRYAQVIDQAKDPAWAMRWIGPLLLDTLQALGATPQARAVLTKGKPGAPDGKPKSQLDVMREQRARRRRA